jgi:hypothetical protein
MRTEETLSIIPLKPVLSHTRIITSEPRRTINDDRRTLIRARFVTAMKPHRIVHRHALRLALRKQDLVGSSRRAPRRADDRLRPRLLALPAREDRE